jgi:hypothetical protein
VREQLVAGENGKPPALQHVTKMPYDGETGVYLQVTIVTSGIQMKDSIFIFPKSLLLILVVALKFQACCEKRS